MVTWNVGDNKGMDNKIKPEAMDKLLGITTHKVADIYAVGLQENCWNCEKNKLSEIPKAFLNQLELKLKGQYEIIGIQATRESLTCICKPKHGTTALFVIAKKGVVKDKKLFNYLTGCSDAKPKPNNEKGVAYMRLELANGQSVCLATNHLESHSPKTRKECLKNFLVDADKNVQWSGCDSKFISGDFNMRTSGEKPGDFKEKTVLDRESKEDDAFVKELKLHDEMDGREAYGKDKTNPHSMLDFINKAQKTTYEESKFTFFPTFHMETGGTCYKTTAASPKLHVLRHCYKTDKPLSWTDRIIFSGAKNLEYDSIDLFESDHLPVFGEFELGLK